MTTFEAGTRVRVTPRFAEGKTDTDGSYAAHVGKEGIVTETFTEPDAFVRVDMPETDFPWLYLPEELEAV